MTDKEVIELAAKAYWNNEVPPHIPCGENGLMFIHGGVWWIPLEDDGDAFRLAVKLNLSYSVNGEYVVVHGDGWPNLVIHRFTGEVIDAVRLAIVMAAAKLGKGM